MCSNCPEGSIQTNGFCDMCGFDEMQYINELEEWQASVDESNSVNEAA